jgi:hypothetical protein
MIVCSCRKISNIGKTKFELLKMLFNPRTIRCGKCLIGLDKPNSVESDGGSFKDGGSIPPISTKTPESRVSGRTEAAMVGMYVEGPEPIVHT